MNPKLSLFDYEFVDNKASQTLFLLHGTGGDKTDFLFLDQYLGKKYNLVGLRGNVSEGGMNRFFRRLEVGVFDQESIRSEAEKLSQFVAAWSQEHRSSLESFAFLGYSNGANMLLATLFYHPQLFRKLVLLHPMLPFEPSPEVNCAGVDVMLAQGMNDEMVSARQQAELVAVLKEKSVGLTAKIYGGGHAIGREELADVVDYLG